MFAHKAIKSHVPARVRAYGRARLDIAQRALTPQDWEKLWKPPIHPFPFRWGPHWKQCVEYRVADFTAEVGFLIDILGLPVNAFNPNYAMFTSPNRDFYFAVVSAEPGTPSTPPDALRIQFMVEDIFALAETLKERGIVFEQEPAPLAENSSQWVASFRTPNGIGMEIWGLVETRPTAAEAPAPFTSDEKETATFAPGERSPTERAQEDTLEDDMDFGESPLSEEAHEEEEPGDSDEEAWGMESDPDEAPTLALKTTPARRLQRQAEQAKFSPPSQSSSANSARLAHLFPREAASSKAEQAENTPRDPHRDHSLSPAPKSPSRKKLSSIWDKVSTDVEYLDLESEPEREYYYKPISLKRGKHQSEGR